MKRFFVSVAVIAISLVSCFGLFACKDKDALPKDSELPNLADCEIGTQFIVYPNVAFNYQIEEGFIVHIDNITATLVEKNYIQENETITEEFYTPYIIEFNVCGSTDVRFANKKIDITITSQDNNSRTLSTSILSDGKIVVTQRFGMKFASNYSFSRIRLIL